MKTILIAAALLSTSAATAADHWVVNASFDDGGTLTGSFDFNVYGFLTGYDLQTSAMGSFAAVHYTDPAPAVSAASGTFGPGSFVTFFSNGYGDQHLTLITSAPLSGGISTLLGSSFETLGYDLDNGVPGGGTTRYLVPGGLLTVPEPASWAMLIAGFGLTGAALRRRQRATA